MRQFFERTTADRVIGPEPSFLKHIGRKARIYGAASLAIAAFSLGACHKEQKVARLASGEGITSGITIGGDTIYNQICVKINGDFATIRYVRDIKGKKETLGFSFRNDTFVDGYEYQLSADRWHVDIANPLQLPNGGREERPAHF